LSDARERHRIGLEIDVARDPDDVEPGEWDLDELMRALRSGAAQPRRVIRGRVTDEEHDPLSATMRGWADDLEQTLRLHWIASSSPDAMIQPAEGAPRPSLETLVELQALAAQVRRLADRLREQQI
jgi:hypothetical protein